MKKIINFIKEKYNKFKELILYLYFGVLTTLVNYIVYFLATRIFSIHYMTATVISWTFAIIFAFVTNRSYVFNSKLKDKIKILNEFIKFVSGRILSLGLEALIMYLGIEILRLSNHDIFVKTIAQVGVVVSNYFLSKYFVFKG